MVEPQNRPAKEFSDAAGPCTVAGRYRVVPATGRTAAGCTPDCCENGCTDPIDAIVIVLRLLNTRPTVTALIVEKIRKRGSVVVANGSSLAVAVRGLRPAAVAMVVLLLAPLLVVLPQPTAAGQPASQFTTAAQDELAPGLVDAGLVPMSAGGAHTCAIDADGNAYC